MSKPYNIVNHLINISANPHPEGIYEDILEAAFLMKQPISIHGERYALMTALDWKERGDKKMTTGAFGVISTFTDIDIDAPWLNRSTGKALEDEDTRRIVIPEAYRPHFAQFIFYFDMKNHLLAFQGKTRMQKKKGGHKNYSLSPTMMKKYLETLLQQESIRQKYDSLGITIIPDPSNLQYILHQKNIREISLTVNVPNSDNIASERDRVRRRMSKINAKRRVDTYTAIDKTGIIPDDEMVREAKVSALDGRVDAKIKTESGTMPFSTADKPLIKNLEIDPKVEQESILIKHFLRDLARFFKA